MTEALLDSQDFISPVAIIVKKESERIVAVDSKGAYRHRKFVNAANCTGTRAATPSNRPPIDISDERTNQKAY